MVIRLLSYVIVIGSITVHYLFGQSYILRRNEVLNISIQKDSIFEINSGYGKPIVARVQILGSDSNSRSVYKFIFRDKRSNQILMTFSDTVAIIYWWTEFKLIDINFDGFLDLEYVSGMAARGYTYNSYALFNPKKKTFSFSKPFSDLCCDLTFDNINKIIIKEGGQADGSGNHSWRYVYKVVNNLPFCIEEEESTDSGQDNTSNDKQIHRKLIDGKWVILNDTLK